MSLGIDIGNRTIKVVELVDQKNNFLLKSAGAVSYNGPSLELAKSEGEIGSFVQILKKLLLDTKVTSKKAAISLPETSVFTRLLKFPLLNDEEIASAVKWESEELIPIPIGDAIVRHAILERQESLNPPQVLTQIIAVHRQLVEKFASVCSEVGIEVIAVENELTAINRSVFATTKKSSFVLVEVGSHSASIGISRQGKLYTTRSLNTGGDSLTRAVTLALGVSQVQAEQYKVAYGMDESQLDGKIYQSLLPVVKLLAEEIRKTIQSYNLETHLEAPDSIIVSGGAAGMNGFTTTLSSLTNMSVTLSNPFSDPLVVDPKSAQSLASYAPLYSCAVGLAMRKD